jgi:hypothetical protein
LQTAIESKHPSIWRGPRNIEQSLITTRVRVLQFKTNILKRIKEELKIIQ